MSRVAYVNGRYLPHHAASVHIEDRGYQFADGVYEVIAVERSRLVDEGLHLARLSRSLRELEIAEPMPERALQTVMREVLSRNRVSDGIIYIQMTRGVAPRDHAYPKHATTQVVMTARRRGRPIPKPPKKASRLSPFLTFAGHAATSSPYRCCPTLWVNSERARPVRTRLGR